MELAPGLHRLEVPFGERINAVYLIAGSERSLLVDTSTKDTAGAVLDECASLGVPAPAWVVTTHADWDHAAGNGVLRQRCPDIQLCCHQDDRAMIEDVELMISDRYGEFAHDHGYDETDDAKDAIRAGTAPAVMDRALTGGERFDLGDRSVWVMHTPGHSHGSISVHDPANNALVIGDAVLGDAVPLADGRPAFPPTYRYLDEYLATIDTIRRLAPELLLTSHYPVYAGATADRFLVRSLEFTDQVDAALRRAIADAGQPVGLLEVAASVSAELGDWPPEAAPALLFPLHGHLERMLASGSVQAIREPADTVTRYRPAVAR